MKAAPLKDGSIVVTLTEAEAVTLHELVAFAEWSEGMAVVEIHDVAEQEVLSRLQIALQPLIRGLGDLRHGDVVQEAWARVKGSDR